MNRTDRIEAAAVLRRLLNVILEVTPGAPYRASASLRSGVGRLNAAAEQIISVGQIGSSLAACFDLSRLAGVTFDGLERVRTSAMGEVPSGDPATVLVQAFLRLVIVEQAIILSGTTFTSRNQIDSAMDRIFAGSDAVESWAADRFQNEAYQAIVSLRAAVIRDLSDRARPLPRIVTYQYPQSMPALWIAQRLYSDGKRSDELIAENSPIHPLFMSPAGRALSV